MSNPDDGHASICCRALFALGEGGRNILWGVVRTRWTSPDWAEDPLRTIVCRAGGAQTDHRHPPRPTRCNGSGLRGAFVNRASRIPTRDTCGKPAQCPLASVAMNSAAGRPVIKHLLVGPAPDVSSQRPTKRDWLVPRILRPNSLGPRSLRLRGWRVATAFDHPGQDKGLRFSSPACPERPELWLLTVAVPFRPCLLVDPPRDWGAEHLRSPRNIARILPPSGDPDAASPGNSWTARPWCWQALLGLPAGARLGESRRPAPAHAGRPRVSAPRSWFAGHLVGTLGPVHRLPHGPLRRPRR